MTVLEDTNQKVGKHSAVNMYFDSCGVDVIRQRLPCGDYVLANEKVFDAYKHLIHLRQNEESLIYGDFKVINRKKDHFTYQRGN